jgi:hypothetical protein
MKSYEWLSEVEGADDAQQAAATDTPIESLEANSGFLPALVSRDREPLGNHKGILRQVQIAGMAKSGNVFRRQCHPSPQAGYLPC